MEKKYTLGIVTAYAHKLYKARPELITSLQKNGFQIAVFGLEDQSLGEQELNPHGIKYIRVNVSRHNLNVPNEIKAYYDLAHKIIENKINIVLSYGIRFVPMVNLAANKAGVISLNVINGAGTLFATSGVKGHLLRSAIFPLIRFSMFKAYRVIFQNPDDVDEFVGRRLVRAGYVKLINGSGVNLNTYLMQTLTKQQVFSIDCRLSKEKGIFELITAFLAVKNDYPDIRLMIAGNMDGLQNAPNFGIFENAVKDKQIEYIGETSDIIGFLNKCRVFVYPSYYREGVPRGVLEAMACGKPIITTDMPGCRETVKNGENGILIQPRDEAGLEEAMRAFCVTPDIAVSMGLESRKYVEEKFDVYNNNRVIIDCIKDGIANE